MCAGMVALLLLTSWVRISSSLRTDSSSAQVLASSSSGLSFGASGPFFLGAAFLPAMLTQPLASRAGLCGVVWCPLLLGCCAV